MSLDQGWGEGTQRTPRSLLLGSEPRERGCVCVEGAWGQGWAPPGASLKWGSLASCREYPACPSPQMSRGPD